MKKLIILSVAIFCGYSIFAQAPQKISYQAVIRNTSNNLVVNLPVKMRISILQGSATGTAVYSELHSATTNANGLVSIEIGGGTSPSGTFSSINWGNGTYFLKTETDPNNGTDYSIVGTSQLLSVPYSLLSGNGFNKLSGDTLFFDNGKNIVIPGISIVNPSSGIALHSCGSINVHNTSVPYGTMTDQEGNVYRTVKIGRQIWMAENLRTTTYRNGIVIPNIFANTQWASATFGALSSFNNNPVNDCPLGKLYNWYAVKDDNQICPSGWHVPSDREWNILIGSLDPSHNPAVANGIQSSIAGGRMKSTGTLYWEPPNNVDATNSTGFSGLPGGRRSNTGSFEFPFSVGSWWTSTESDLPRSLSRDMFSSSGNVNRSTFLKSTGLSVRCLKD